MGEIAIETLAEEMYQMVAEYAGKRNLKATDLTKAAIAKHGDGACDKEDCKKAIRLLIDSGRCVYSYLGGSYTQLPPPGGCRPLAVGRTRDNPASIAPRVSSVLLKTLRGSLNLFCQLSYLVRLVDYAP